MTTSTYRIANSQGVFWWEGARLYRGTHRDVGITDNAGRWLSLDGVTPYFPRGGRRALASTLDTLDEHLAKWQWVDPAAPCQTCDGEDRSCASCRGTGRARPAA